MSEFYFEIHYVVYRFFRRRKEDSFGRGIARIDYDRLNNPVRIQFTDGSVTRYVYSAAGEKLRVTHLTAVPNITVAIGSARELSPSEILSADSTDYLLGGSLTLRNGRIDKLQFDEGYCQATKYIRNFSQDNFTFYYYDRDHLGSIRQVVKETGSNNGTVVQTMDYYPFGAQFCHNSTDSEVQSRKYNGKEFDKMHGLNTYDYGARQYNPVTARWDRVDPLCEKYYAISPYAYCHDNPINRIDPDGRDDYYSSNGDFMYRDSKDTDRIMMTRWTIHVDFKDGEKMVAIGGVPIEKKDDISAETYSNIFTDIVSKMPDVDLTKLRKEHISVIVWNGIEDGKLSSTNTFNRPDEESGKLASTGNTRITASINLIKDNRIFFSTVSNIQSILGIHEYKGHFVNHMGDESKTHHNIYEMQMNDPTWNKITDDLKENIINNYMKYLQDEK
jgi:RHS repeat-associated protein